MTFKRTGHGSFGRQPGGSSRGVLHLAQGRAMFQLKLSTFQRRIVTAAILACLCSGDPLRQIRLQPLLDVPDQAGQPSVSPDGKSLAFVWCPSDESKWALYVVPMGGGAPRLFAASDDRGVPEYPTWSPDGKWIAFLRSEASHGAIMFVKSLAGGEERVLGVVCNDRQAWSANSEFVIAPGPGSSNGCGLTIYPIGPGGAARELGLRGGSPVQSRTGEKVAFVRDNEILLLPLTAEGEPAAEATKLIYEPLGISSLTWAPDNNEIIYVPLEDRSLIKWVAARPGAAPRDVGRVEGSLVSLVASSSGELVGEVMRGKNSLWATDPRGADSRPFLIQELPWNAGPAKVSPDGRKLAYSLTEGPASEVYLTDLGGAETRRLFTISYHVEQLSWSPDGGRIAIVAEQPGQEQIEPSLLFVAPVAGGFPRRLLEKFDNVYSAAWSNDGRSLFVAVGSAGKDSIMEMKLQDGSTTRITHGGSRELAESPDGRFLYFIQSLPLSLLRRSLGGGDAETLVSGALRFAVGDDTVYFLRQDLRPPASRGLNLYRIDGAARTPRLVANVGFVPSSMQLSRSGKAIYMERNEPTQDHIMVVRDWRAR
jgi:Tol biopolymer transport system component